MLGFVADVLGTMAKEEYANERQEDSQQFNSAEAAATRDWQERMDNTAIQRRFADMRAAGVNPLLSVHPGAVHGTPSGATASSGIGGSGGNTNFAGSLFSAAQVDATEALADKYRAEADAIRGKTPLEMREIEARIPTHPQAVAESQQRVGESAVRIEKLWEEMRREAASAANLNQQTENLKESISLIRANVAHLKALADQSSAATAEIKQRVRQDLPALEKILMNLERVREEMAQPGHANAERAQDSLIGQIGAYLKALGGLPGALILKGRTNVNKTSNITNKNQTTTYSNPTTTINK